MQLPENHSNAPNFNSLLNDEQRDSEKGASIPGLNGIKPAPTDGESLKPATDKVLSYYRTGNTAPPLLSENEYDCQVTSNDYFSSFLSALSAIDKIKKKRTKFKSLMLKAEINALKKAQTTAYVTAAASMAATGLSTTIGVAGTRSQLKGIKKDVKSLKNHIGNIDFNKMKGPNNKAYRNKIEKKMKLKDKDLRAAFDTYEQDMAHLSEQGGDTQAMRNAEYNLQSRVTDAEGVESQRFNINASKVQLEATKFNNFAGIGQSLSGAINGCGEGTRTGFTAEQKVAEEYKNRAGDDVRMFGESIEKALKAMGALYDALYQSGSQIASNMKA